MKTKSVYKLATLVLIIVIFVVILMSGILKPDPQINFIKPLDEGYISEDFDLIVSTNIKNSDFNLIFKKLNGVIISERLIKDKENNKENGILLKDKVSIPDNLKEGDSFLLMVEAFKKDMKQSPENLIFRKQIKLSFEKEND